MTPPVGRLQAKPPQPPSGSDRQRSGPDFLVIGRIIKPHGIRGEVAVKALTDFPERFESITTVYVGDETSARRYTITATRPHKQGILCVFEAVSDRDAAEALRGLYLKIPIEEAMPLPADTYYHHQLIGLQVVTDTGLPLGRLADILETGANDVYVVHGSGSEVLLPATAEVIRSVDLAAGQMVVHLLDGLV